MERRLAAILAADVVGYSKLMGEDEAGTLAALRGFRNGDLADAMSGHRGNLVKSMGDGWLIEFASAGDAVSCALEIQEALSIAPTFKLRIGLHIGDVTFEDEDIYGDGVNIAARLQEAALPGAIVVSDMIHRAIDGKLAATFADLGGLSLKNISEPVAAFARGMQAQDITSQSANVNGDMPSIAVLPFSNRSGDVEQDYFSDGIAEDIITDLSKISSILVIARNSSFSYKDKNVSAKDVAKDLGVEWVLEGSVRKAGNQVRITAQLINGLTGAQNWAERYDRSLDDVFAIQDEITQEVTAALRINLDLDGRVRHGSYPTNNPQAHDLAKRGFAKLYTHTRSGILEARQLFEDALKIDPNYVMPHFGLAIVLGNIYANRWDPDVEKVRARSFELAERAIDIAPNSPQAHWAMALSHLWSMEPEAAVAEAQIALDLAPNLAEAFTIRGHASAFAGDTTLAVSSLESAMRLDPHCPHVWLHFLGHAHFVGRDYDKAVEQLQRRIEKDPGTDLSRVLLASCFGHLGRLEEARAAWEAALQVNPDFSLAHRAKTMPYKYPSDWQHYIDGLRAAGIEDAEGL